MSDAPGGMDEATLAGIEQRANAATKGEWIVGGPGFVYSERDKFLIPVARTGANADAEFIAHARTDVPALVAEVRRLSAALDEQQRRIEDAALFCRLTMRYEPSSDTTLASQRTALGVLDALGVEFDRDEYLARLAAAPSGEPNPCCDLHGSNCEPLSELCCGDCTEAHHGMHADPPHYDRTLSSHHDGSRCVLDLTAPSGEPNTEETK